MAFWHSTPDIVKLKSKRDIGGLVNALANDGHVSRQAKAALIELHDPSSVEPLINLLVSPSDRLARTAVDILGSLGDRQAVPALIDLLTQSRSYIETHDPDVLAATVAYALSRIGDVQALPALIDALRQHMAEPVRKSLAEALGRFGDSRARPVLEECLRNRERVKGRDRELGYFHEAAEKALILVRRGELSSEEIWTKVTALVRGIGAGREHTYAMADFAKLIGKASIPYLEKAKREYTTGIWAEVEGSFRVGRAIDEALEGFSAEDRLAAIDQMVVVNVPVASPLNPTPLPRRQPERQEVRGGCSFCPKKAEEAITLISSPKEREEKAYICNECVGVFADLLGDNRRSPIRTRYRPPLESKEGGPLCNCNFCGKDQRSVGRLVTSALNRIHICDECIVLCESILGG